MFRKIQRKTTTVEQLFCKAAGLGVQIYSKAQSSSQLYYFAFSEVLNFANFETSNYW